MVMRARRSRRPESGPLQKAWVKFAAIAAGFAIIITLLSNAVKFTDWSRVWLSYGVEQAGRIALYPSLTRNLIAREALSGTYDGQACLAASAPISLDGDGRNNDLQAGFFYSPSGHCDEDQNDVRVSMAYYAFRGGGFNFIGDVSGYDYLGLTSENIGKYLIETPSQASTPDISILELQGTQLVLVKRLRAWADYGDGDELVQMDYQLNGNCLDVVTAATGQVEHVCPGATGTENDLSFAKRITLDDGKLTVDGYETPADIQNNHVFSLYVDPFARLYFPGNCFGTDNVSQSRKFFGANQITDYMAKVIDGTDVIAKVSCTPNMTVKLQRG